MSGELMPAALTAEDARKVTDLIRADYNTLWAHCLEAYERNVHGALGYPSWAAYCVVELDMSKRQAYRLIEAGKVVRMLQCPIGHSPKTEGVARELAPLLDDPEALRLKWDEVVNRAPCNDAGEPVITAKHVRAIVRGPEPEKEDKAKVRGHKEIERPKNDDDRFDDLMAAWIVAPESVRTKFLNAINGIVDESDDGVDPMCWGEFVAHRKAIRKPLSSMSASKNRKILAGLSVTDQRRAVDTTIANNWTGIFPPKADNGTHSQNRPQSAVDRVRAAAAAREAADADY